MVDIIIPVYNNPKGLADTLMSIGTIEETKITIIDDCSSSDQLKEIVNIVNTFSNIYDITFIKNKVNCGPGVSRQTGLDATSSDYVMFVDCGDMLYHPRMLMIMRTLLEEEPKSLFLSGGYYYEYPEYEREDSISLFQYNTPHRNIRIHGKMYKRSFIDKYGIKFDSVSSYSNEDSGFNQKCFAMADMIQKTQEEPAIINLDDPCVIWAYDKDSICRKDNFAFYYTQAIGSALNTDCALKFCYEHNVDDEIIKDLIYRIMLNMYVLYVSALNEKPELAESVLEGALFHYTNHFCNSGELDEELFLYLYNDTMKSCYRESWDPFRLKIVTISIIDFLNILEEKKESK